MAIVRRQDAIGQGSNGSINVTLDTYDVAAGSLLLCCASWYGGTGTAAVSDNQSNSWVDLYDNNYDSVDYGYLGYVLNANSGSTTVTFDPGGASSMFFTVVLIEVTGIKTTGALDQSNQNTATSSSWDSGNITTTENDEYIIGVLALDNGDQALTEDGEFTLIHEEETGSTNMPISVSERIVSSTLTESYSGTIGASSAYWAAIASFEAVAGAAIVGPFPTHFRIP